MIGAGVGPAEFTVTGEAIEVDADQQKSIDAAVALVPGPIRKAQAAQLVPRGRGVRRGVPRRRRRRGPGAVRPEARLLRAHRADRRGFGDLDPAIDYRKPGAEAKGLEFTGFHRIEMDLWVDDARQKSTPR